MLTEAMHILVCYAFYITLLITTAPTVSVSLLHQLALIIFSAIIETRCSITFV